MQTLILKREQGILLAPDDKIGGGNEPLEIRFSLINFAPHKENESSILFNVEEPAIRKLRLTPGETIILTPGEMMTPASEPMMITFGMPDFNATGRSAQEQILASIVKCLLCAIPAAWQIEVVKHFRKFAEQIDKPIVRVIPQEITWKRTAKGRQYREHVVDILLLGKLETDSTVQLLDQWAELFLDGGGPLEHACMNVTTLDIAEAGYSVEALTNTPSLYIGGLQLTFWEF